MKQLFLATMALSFVPLWQAHAQANVYVDLTAAKFTNLVSTSYLYGPTFGISNHLLGGKRLALFSDVRGQALGTGQAYDSIAVGPRVQLRLKGINTYGEFLVGFARYNDGAGHATTDSQIDVNAGIEHTLKGPLSWRIFEYGYKQYYGLGGQFDPKSFSTGLIYTIGGK